MIVGMNRGVGVPARYIDSETGLQITVYIGVELLVVAVGAAARIERPAIGGAGDARRLAILACAQIIRERAGGAGR